MVDSIAVFDFDNTITDRDSLLPLLFYVRGCWRSVGNLLALTPDFVRFLMRNLSRQQIKEKILKHFFGGMSFADLQVLGREYAEKKLDSYLKPEAIKRLKWHQLRGDRCILISASLEFYLKPWAMRHGFEEVLASRLELTPAGIVTGHLVGLNCWGPEKENRLRAYLGKAAENGELQLYVYGDSRGDREILAMADHPFYRTFTGGIYDF